MGKITHIINTNVKMFAITNDKKRIFVIEILNIICTRKTFSKRIRKSIRTRAKDR